ncbi:glutathione S-transferase N-terminal domain-containing protein [Vibrio paucivorans]|uniref:Glutathione S-transferase N-terminal domain-containing protein n=1 Tax=Vibrio paucivorans TaxID=2829489 RepID=A0A9X3HRJ8_9VIBR|nr:glutathione S-transferase N-terminal domain-containing protein [Vibrio paucivorans]MCW8333986.1 glutathione S-transferase N-terminal domain-containing protein [Vibrio paucivorans]
MKMLVGIDSTWSLRAWLCARLSNQSVDLQVLDLSKPEAKSYLAELSPSALVPVLEDGELHIHDSLAISEYLNELSPGCLYPPNLAQRAVARSLCAELHSGFFQLRSQCPFTFDTPEPVIINEQLAKEVDRVKTIFSMATLPFMYEEAGVVDCFYAVLAYRLRSYGIQFDGVAGRYQNQLLEWSLLKEAMALAHAWREKV